MLTQTLESGTSRLFPAIELLLWGLKKNAPAKFMENIELLKENVEFAKWGLKNKAPPEFYENFNKLLKNIDFAKWGVKNSTSKKSYVFDTYDIFGTDKVDPFYLFFDVLKDDIELAKLGLKKKAPADFYEHFPQFKKDMEV
ncbi:MAG: hypothetical protein ACFE8P_13825, partial [Promethearchaeota archaeon]